MENLSIDGIAEEEQVYDVDSPPRRVSNVLMSKYGIKLAKFENSIQVIKSNFQLLFYKRSILKTRQIITYLERSKGELVYTIEKSLTKSESWNWIRNNFRGMHNLNENHKANFIRSEFHLDHYFRFVDERIAELNKKLRLLDSVSLIAEGNKKLAGPQTILVLVWVHAFICAGASSRKSYAETRLLLNWFSNNRQEALRGLCGQLVHRAPNTIRREYERSVIHPTNNRKIYGDLALSLYDASFENYD